MKRSNMTCTLGAIFMVASYLSASQQAAARGYQIDAGLYAQGSVSGSLGVGTAYQGGLCGSPCSSSFGGLYGSQYAGLPAALPKQQIPLRIAPQPYGPSGWVNSGNGNGYPGMGYPNNGWGNSGYPGNGFPGGGMYPGNGFPGVGFPGNGYPGLGFPNNGFNLGQCGGGCSNGGAYGYQPLSSLQVAGGPIGMNSNYQSYLGGGSSCGMIIDARSRAAWEIPDDGFIISATGAALIGMTSNVYPVAYERAAQTIPEIPAWGGNRHPGFEPRPGLHANGSTFQ